MLLGTEDSDHLSFLLNLLAGARDRDVVSWPLWSGVWGAHDPSYWAMNQSAENPLHGQGKGC